MQKDEILERLVFSEGVVEAYAKAENTHEEPSGDHWSRPVLLERAAYLRKLARFGEGSASETIREFPGHSMMLMVLLRSGDAVVQEDCAHILTVLEGRATLVTGGTLERAKQAGAGEARGSAISGGSSREVRAGDVIQLEAGVPHQFLLTGENTLSCLVVRVKGIVEAR
jgi:mannose-6-phosphate isomerase-like protein (cupin superfamily)